MTRSKRKNLDGNIKENIDSALKDSSETIKGYGTTFKYFREKFGSNNTNKFLIASIFTLTLVIFILFFTLCGLVNTVDTCDSNDKEKQLKLNSFRNSVQVLLTFIPLLVLSFTLPSHHSTSIFRYILLIVVIGSSLSSLYYLGKVGADNSISGVLISILVLICIIAVLIAVFYGVNNKKFFNKALFEPGAAPFTAAA